MFGFSYKETDKEDKTAKASPIPPNSDDGVAVSAGGLYGYGIDMDQTGQKDYDLIRRYRAMALTRSGYIEDIVNEALSPIRTTLLSTLTCLTRRPTESKLLFVKSSPIFFTSSTSTTSARDVPPLVC